MTDDFFHGGLLKLFESSDAWTTAVRQSASHLTSAEQRITEYGGRMFPGCTREAALLFQ